MIPALNQVSLKPDIPKGHISNHSEDLPGITVTELPSPGKQKFPVSSVLPYCPVLPFQSSHQTATGSCQCHCGPLQNQPSSPVFLNCEIQLAL